MTHRDLDIMTTAAHRAAVVKKCDYKIFTDLGRVDLYDGWMWRALIILIVILFGQILLIFTLVCRYVKCFFDIFGREGDQKNSILEELLLPKFWGDLLLTPSIWGVG